MRSSILSPRRSSLAWAALLLSGGSAMAQSAGYPYPYTGYPYPLSSFSAAAPYWGSVPSYYGGAPLPYQENGISLRPATNYFSSPPMFFPGYLGAASSYSALSNAGILWPSSKGTALQDTRAHIWLRVPDNAEVRFEGAKTKQTGTLRYYFTPQLAAGKSYSYRVQVRWQKDGKPVERKRRIGVHAGETVHVDLN